LVFATTYTSTATTASNSTVEATDHGHSTALARLRRRVQLKVVVGRVAKARQGELLLLLLLLWRVSMPGRRHRTTSTWVNWLLLLLLLQMLRQLLWRWRAITRVTATHGRRHVTNSTCALSEVVFFSRKRRGVPVRVCVMGRRFIRKPLNQWSARPRQEHCSSFFSQGEVDGARNADNQN
jgi:hypothetical protein